MHEWVCLLSLSGTPNTRSSAWFLLRYRDGSKQDTLPMPPVFLFAEACPATPFVPQCRQGQFGARSATRRRLCGTWSRSRTTVPVRDTHALPCGRASLPRGMTTRHLTFRRDGTGHRPLPPATPQNWAPRPMLYSPRPTLHQSSAAATSPEPAQLALAPASNRSSVEPGNWSRLPRT